MAEREAREHASPRSAAGRWKPAAGSRAEHGDAADVEFDVVLARAVACAVREVCRRFCWQGQATRTLVSSGVASDDGATTENKDGANAADKRTKQRSPSYRRRSRARLVQYMKGKMENEDAGKQHFPEAAAATEAPAVEAAMEQETAAAERGGQRQAAGERGGRRVQWPPDAQLSTITEYQVPQQRDVINSS